jgi:uncharacterized repeat protein (TIGR03837 family)
MPDVPKTPRCDLFCTVVDNFGDAGVCWRLARQWARERGWQVRLFIDQPEVLAAFLPELHAALRNRSPGQPWSAVINGVEIAPWPAHHRPAGSASGAASGATSDTASDVASDATAQAGTGAETPTAASPADIVVEAFACELPEHYLNAMARQPRAPVWINLDYLSAEAWVVDFHLGKSSHPRLMLEKTFFFPGLQPGTGGLLRESDLSEQRSAFLSDSAAQARLLARLGLPMRTPGTTVITLFGYENPAVTALLTQWSASPHPIQLWVPEGRISPQLAQYFGRDTFTAGQQAQRGALSAYALPFVDQPAYDRLLWLADFNFVRGEDSFVRAQWAERPFVWQIYPQSDDAHRIKLDAMLHHYVAALDPESAAAVIRFWHAWNGDGAPDWHDLWRHRGALETHAPRWASRLREAGSLSENLAVFAENRLK